MTEIEAALDRLDATVASLYRAEDSEEFFCAVVRGRKALQTAESVLAEKEPVYGEDALLPYHERYNAAEAAFMEAVR